MVTLLTLFIHTLIVFRISYSLTEEDGPFNVFSSLRNNTKKYNFLPFQCLYCTSVWIGVALSLFLGQDILYGLALSAGAIIVYSLVTKLNQ